MAGEREPEEGAGGAPEREIEVWDLPVRLFHWLLVLCLVGAVGSALNEELEIHERFGVAILVLLVFRVLWGFLGGEHARFAAFVRGPAAALAYLRRLRGGGAAAEPGHNPLGGWSVLAMLAVLAVQAGLGLFATDDILFDGPLAWRVSTEESRFLTSLHHLNLWAVGGLVALHLAAVLSYFVLFRKNLVRPMVTGRTKVPPAAAPARTRPGPVWRAALLLALSAALVLGLVYGL